MTLWQRAKKKIKEWFTGGSKKTTAPKPRTNRDARNETVSSQTTTFNRRELLNSLKNNQKEEERVKTQAKSYEPKKFERFQTMSEKKKQTSDSKSELRKRLDDRKKEREAFHKTTGHKYDTTYGTAEQRARARQRIKSGDYQGDADVIKHEVKYHPIAASAARGALSGTTFGLSDLAAKKLTKGRAREAEEYYQKHKNKIAEGAGELVGSLASFGATAGATERLGAAAAKKLAPNAAEKLAGKAVIKNAAKRSVNKAVKKGLVGEASEELIKQVGKDKAAKIVNLVGGDIVQNLTTGAIYDLARASEDYEVGSKEWMKELGKSAAINFGVTGGIAGASALRGGKGIAKEAAQKISLRNGLRELAESQAGAPKITAPRIGESIEDRIARIDAERIAKTADDTKTLIEPRTLELQRVEPTRVEVPKAEFDAEAYRKSLDDVIPFSSETPKAADDFPFATVDDALPSTNPRQTAINETTATLENRVKQLEDIKQVADERLQVNKVAEDRPISEGLPSGVKQVRSAYDYNNGEKIEDGVLTSWNEAWKASKEYSASHATGETNRMSKVAVSQLNAMDSEAERALRQRLVDSGDLNYDAISTPEMYDKIAKQMRDDPDRWVKDMIGINEGGALDFRSTPEWQARVQYILGTVDPSADPASEIAYTEAFKLAQNISSKGGQVLNLRRNFVHLTPLGKRDAILDDFISILYKSKGFRKNHPKLNSLGHFDQRNYIRDFLMGDEGIMKGVQKVVDASELDDVSEAFTELMVNVNQKNPKAGFDVLQELRYLNMLGNPKTHLRNVLGSAFFSPMRQASNAIRAGIEDAIIERASKTAGTKLDVTRHGGLSLEAAKEAWATNPTTEAGKAAKEAFERLRTEVLGSAKYETVMYKGRGKTAVGKTLDAISDFNSKWLAKEDDFFRSRAFKENYIKSYNRYLKDGKPITDKIKKRIEQEALQESQIATFNEFNEFARLLNRVQSKANDVNASGGARWGARAVNAAMPFTKVPANLMKQSVNYSPLGIAKGMSNIKTAAKRGDAAMLNKAIDELSSGLTGSMVFGLGMLLGKTTHNMFGVDVTATTNTGKNDPAAKFKKDRGMQNYSITFKDPETGQGHSFTLDWLVPASATFFSGVEFANQLKQGNLGLSAFGDWSTVVSRLAEPVMETSMLSGLHGMLETMRSGSRSDDDKGAPDILIRELVQSYLNSIIPTVAGQAARTAYKTDMQVTGDTDWEYWKNQMKSKSGLANTEVFGEALGADTDAYGNVKGEKKSTEDYIKSGLKNFLSPANIQKVDFSEVDNEKLRIYEEAVANGADPSEMEYLFPKKQYKKQFKVAGEEVKMSNRDLSTYNKAKATGGEEGMRYVLENIMFNRRTTDENGKNVPRDDAYTAEQKQALMNKFKGKSMREVEEWLYEQPEFKSATPAEQKKAIKGLWSLDSTFDSKAHASRRVGEQAVIKAQGGDVDEYNFKNEVTEKKRDELKSAIDAGILTYGQVVDFNRNAAKMGYYETEEGGYSRASYNREGILTYLDNLDAPEEAKEALYNAYYTGKTPYGADVYRGRRGYGGYRRYYRRGRGGGKAKLKPTTASDFKAKKFTASSSAKAKSGMPSLSSSSRSTGGSSVSKPSYKSPAVSLKTKSSKGGSSANYKTSAVKYDTASAVKPKSKKKKTTVKTQPPKVKFKKYEV